MDANISGWDRRSVLTAMGAVALPSCARGAAQEDIGPVLRTSGHPSLAVAVEQWTKSGGTLIIDRDYDLPAPLTMIARPGLSYRLTTQGPRRILYTGGRYHWAVCLYSEGRTPFVIDGRLTIDGANRVSIAFFARFENVSGALRRDFSVDGLECMNARTTIGRSPIDGSATNAYNAAGMYFVGGFDRLHLRNIIVANVTREARSGIFGSKGSLGVGVVAKLGSTSSARHILIEDFEVSRVDSDDPSGSSERWDMDGVLVFQSAERDGTRPVIRRGVIREAAGRGVKVFAPGGGGTTQYLKIYRSVPSGQFGAADVQHQHGDGLIADIELFYSGRAHQLPTTPISFSAGSSPSEWGIGVGEARNIRIHDTTGKVKGVLVGFQYNVVGDKRPRRYVISGLTDNGLARYLFLPGALGTYGQAMVEIDDVHVNLTDALFASEDPTQLLRVRVRCSRFNRTRHLPEKVRYDGAPVAKALAVRVDVDASVTGLCRIPVR
jgi:hypothetical protein